MLGASIPANKPRLIFTVAAELNLFFIFKFQSCETTPPSGSQVKGKTVKRQGRSASRPSRAAARPYPQKSGEKTSRRRCRRLKGEGLGESIRQWQKFKPARRNQNEIFRRRREFELLSLQRELFFLLGFFSGGDGLAEAARMPAIERLLHGFGKGVRAQIVREHRRPRHRLQRGPLRAGHRNQRHNHTKFAEPDEHNGKLYHLCRITSANNDL